MEDVEDETETPVKARRRDADSVVESSWHRTLVKGGEKVNSLLLKASTIDAKPMSTAPPAVMMLEKAALGRSAARRPF